MSLTTPVNTRTVSQPIAWPVARSVSGRSPMTSVEPSPSSSANSARIGACGFASDQIGRPIGRGAEKTDRSSGSGPQAVGGGKGRITVRGDETGSPANRQSGIAKPLVGHRAIEADNDSVRPPPSPLCVGLPLHRSLRQHQVPPPPWRFHRPRERMQPPLPKTRSGRGWPHIR